MLTYQGLMPDLSGFQGDVDLPGSDVWCIWCAG
jgi:hypothetical protein